MDDYERVRGGARSAPARVVLVGENDHYKPLAVTLRRLLAARRHRRTGVCALHDHRQAPEAGRRLAQRRDDGRRRRVLRRRHPLAARRRQPRSDGSSIDGYRPAPSREGPDTRVKSMMVAFQVRQRRRRVAVLLAGNPVALPRAARLEAVRQEGRHHLRVERLVRHRARRRAAAGAVPRVPRHSRLPGDVPGFCRRHPGRARAGDEPRAGDRGSAAHGPGLRAASGTPGSEPTFRHHHHRHRRRWRHDRARAVVDRRTDSDPRAR